MAMQMAAGLINPVVSPLVDKVMETWASGIADWIRSQWDDHGEVGDLVSKLSTIRSVLADAEERQVTSYVVSDLLQKLKDVSFDIEDIVDEFAFEALKAQVEGTAETSKKRMLDNFYPKSHWKKLQFQKKMRPKLEETGQKLKRIEDEMKYLHFTVPTEVPTRRLHSLPLTSSLVSASNVVGRQTARDKLIELLLLDDPNRRHPSVVSIVGMGGIGKTTLAQLVYNSERIDEHFSCKAWVCVSEPFDVVRVTKAIIESITRQSCHARELDPLHHSLKELLSGKRFLLVLDDVWTEEPNHWDLLCLPLRVGVEGSKIVVTTRNHTVARTLGTSCLYDLEGLSEDDSWTLFTLVALGGASFEAYPGLEEVGKQIVVRCGGLPLAIKALGGMLSSTRHTTDWEHVLKSPLWELSEGEQNVLPVLKVSYHHLRAPVKSCFMYCCLFPKDYIFQKHVLVELWVGAGYILPQGARDEKDIAGQYFDDLLGRSFLHKIDEGSHHQMFKMHDMVHDLAEFLSKEELVRAENSKPFEVLSQRNVRHASFVFEMNSIEMRTRSIYECQKLRTYLIMGQTHFMGLYRCSDPVPREPNYFGHLLHLNCLRVLCLWHFGIEELPTEIGNLKLLQHLDISYNPIKRLPDCVSTLYNLQTLNLRGCLRLLELPRGIWNLHNLRNLYLRECRFLYLRERRLYVPPGISKVTKLRELPFDFYVVKGSGDETTEPKAVTYYGNISDLKEMNSVRGSIEIKGLESLALGEEARDANLKNKLHLKSLSLEWSSGLRDGPLNDDEVLDGLQPPANLEKLHIRHCNAVALPSWSDQLSNLRELTLLGMRLLTVFNGAYHSRSVPLFPRLEKLCLLELSGLEEWSGIDQGDMPCLRLLIINHCQKLRRLPPVAFLKLEIVHLWDLPSLEELFGAETTDALHLQEVKVSSCPLLSLLPKTCSMLKALIIEDCDLLTGQGNISFLSNFLFVEELELRGCSNLVSLPPLLSNLTGLKKLILIRCPLLASLPDNLPKSLKVLHIESCPLLEEAFKTTGEEWVKMAHIPDLQIGFH